MPASGAGPWAAQTGRPVVQGWTVTVHRPALTGLRGLPVLVLGQVTCWALSSPKGAVPPGGGLMAHHRAHGTPQRHRDFKKWKCLLQAEGILEKSTLAHPIHPPDVKPKRYFN